VDAFPATRQSALQRLDEFLSVASRYAAERNRVLPGHPNVSRLSAALRHRLITEAEVVEAAMRQHSFRAVEKFLQEVLWRSYWKGWLEMRPPVWERYRTSADHLVGNIDPDMAAACREVGEGRSRSGVMNHFARELRETGYMHNHARMWWASFWIHHCGLPWELGAQHFFRHLLDADPASNTLSWRWVAGRQTRGKAYLASAQNVRKFCAPEILERAGDVGFDGRATARVSVDDEQAEVTAAVLPLLSQSVDPRACQQRVALVLHDEDLCLETSPAAGVRPVVILQVIKEERLPPPRAHWLGQARADAARRTREHFRCEVRACSTRAEIAAAGAAEKIERVVMMEPHVGPLRDHLQGLADELSLRGVGMDHLRRRWDAELLPQANRGFFPFWNKVGRRLEKSGLEGLV
jgi:deoxyribodipyrimidine photo-lyase